MAKIYLTNRKELKQKFDNLANEDVKCQITLKKVYYKMHNVLKDIYPTCLANMINEYITEETLFNIIAEVENADVDYDGLTIKTTICSSKDKFNYYVLVSPTIIQCTLENEITDNNVMEFVEPDIFIIPFFNYYLHNILQSKKIFKDWLKSSYDFKLTSNNTITYTHTNFAPDIIKIVNHKKLQNLIIMLYIITKLINKSLIKYQNNLQEFFKVHRLRCPVLYSKSFVF